MKVLFKQRVFSWLDSYDIYTPSGQALYTVKGRVSFGHRLELYDDCGRLVGHIQEKLLSFLPAFYLYDGDHCFGQVRKELSFLHPVYRVHCNGWQARGDLMGWNYQIEDSAGGTVATVEKQLFNFSDTYEIDVRRHEDLLLALMVVLAIDAACCSKG